MQDDRRRVPRVPVFFMVESIKINAYENAAENQGVVKNITLDGVLLESNVKLQKHDRLQLSFILPNVQKAVQVEAEVRWVENKKAWSMAGLEFMNLTVDQREAIMAYCLTLGI